MTATDSGWLSLIPRRLRLSANSAATKMKSLSFSLGVRSTVSLLCMGFSGVPQAQGHGRRPKHGRAQARPQFNQQLADVLCVHPQHTNQHEAILLRSEEHTSELQSRE